VSGLGKQQLLALDNRLSERDLLIINTVDRFRLLQAEQLRRLYFNEISTLAGSARICRRALARLVDERVLHRLTRRVGGVRAGSSGHIYTLTAAGKRLLAYQGGQGLPSDRGVHEPGEGFVQHTLAIAELYTALVEQERAGRLQLVRFDPEPACWRTHRTGFAGSIVLKPDAYAELAAGAFDHANFVEIDLASEGKQALLRKLRAYVSYYRSGREQSARGWSPRTVWITTTPARATLIEALVRTLPGTRRSLFTVGLPEQAVDLLLGTGEEAGRAEALR
jgi:hypothetical protein